MLKTTKRVDGLLDAQAAGRIDALTPKSPDRKRWEAPPARTFQLLTGRFDFGARALHLRMNRGYPGQNVGQ